MKVSGFSLHMYNVGIDEGSKKVGQDPAPIAVCEALVVENNAREVVKILAEVKDVKTRSGCPLSRKWN